MFLTNSITPKNLEVKIQRSKLIKFQIKKSKKELKMQGKRKFTLSPLQLKWEKCIAFKVKIWIKLKMKSPQIELILAKFIQLQSFCRQELQTSSRAVAVKKGVTRPFAKRSRGIAMLWRMQIVNLKRTWMSSKLSKLLRILRFYGMRFYPIAKELLQHFRKKISRKFWLLNRFGCKRKRVTKENRRFLNRWKAY